METRQFARWYAKRGFHIFPCHTIEDGKCSCGKKCSSPGKHPVANLAGHGVLDATTDLAIVDQWWSMFPDANIGLATGMASGVTVIDIDPDHGGEVTWDNLTQRHETPDTWAVITGSGGVHFYFEAMDGIRNSASVVGPGVDVRSDGGYVIAPPSRHVLGGCYEWSPTFNFKTMETPASLPDWLISRVVPKSIRANASAQPLPEKITEGARNQWMASIAGTMRRRGMSRQAIEAALKVENRMRCSPRLDEREIERIAQSIDRYPASVSGLTAKGWKAAS